MSKINIGFMGGCLNNQKGISRNDLYYSILSKNLQKNNPETEYQISLGSYLSFDQLVNQSTLFIEKKKPTILSIFIRPFPLMPLQKLIVKYDKMDGKNSWAFHPALFNRAIIWNEQFTKYQTEHDFIFVPKQKIGLRDFNLIAGILLGLHFWARKYVAHQIQILKQICDKENIRLKIISPPQNPESLFANLTCKWFANFFKKFCKEKSIEFISIYSFSIDNFEKDNVHFNIHGHEKLAAIIYESLIGLEK